MTEETKPAETAAPAPEAAPAVKTGFKTTEFWLSSIAAVVGIVMASGLADDHVAMKVAGIAATVLAALGYSVSRGMAKGSK